LIGLALTVAAVQYSIAFSHLLLTVIILVTGAVSAVIGIGQYLILHHDLLGHRVRSTLGHYMTFSRLMMLPDALPGSDDVAVCRDEIAPRR
jgi:hypothetical protein